MSFRNRLPSIVSVVALIAGSALYALHADYRQFLDTPFRVPADGSVLAVKPGAGIGDIARELPEQPVLLRSAPYLEAYVRLNGLAARLKAGEDAITPDTTPRALIDRIVACLLYPSPSPRDRTRSRMPSSAWKKKKPRTLMTQVSS
ncbi:MAG TPA: hypothetical protein DIC59_09455, partial [Candidatus Competibacteraceae bacterium]|nr:hypothetical protein [Candidatus Competibacteraceae bacterium]